MVAFKPRWGAYIVALWLLGIIVNLLSYPGFYDVALRDFGLLLGALALGRLSEVYQRTKAEPRGINVDHELTTKGLQEFAKDYRKT